MTTLDAASQTARRTPSTFGRVDVSFVSQQPQLFSRPRCTAAGLKMRPPGAIFGCRKRENVPGHRKNAVLSLRLCLSVGSGGAGAFTADSAPATSLGGCQDRPFGAQSKGVGPGFDVEVAFAQGLEPHLDDSHDVAARVHDRTAAEASQVDGR